MFCAAASAAYTLPLVNSLQRRHGGHDHDDEPQCGEGQDLSEYHVQDNIIGLFVILCFSFLGCGFAALAGRLRVNTLLVDLGRHFGTGVIISTGFVHMLMAAIEHLTSPCAPEAIRKYSAFACVVTMGAALFMHLVEQLGGRCNSLDQKQGYEMTTYMLEAGILSHSVLIGLSLGVASGNEFLALVIAITFHQFFEGVALGVRIGELAGRVKPFLMVVAYSVITPAGILLGIGIRNLYSENSGTSALTMGILDAISSGILIYTGLVILVGRDLSAGSDSAAASPRTRSLHLLSLYFGVAVMAVIGIWA